MTNIDHISFIYRFYIIRIDEKPVEMTEIGKSKI